MHEETPAGSKLPAGGVGEYEQRLAVSSLAQQVSLAVATVTALIAITALARNLSLGEFGTYGLLVSLTTYVQFLQTSVESMAIKAVAEARYQVERDETFSTAIALYFAAGLSAGGLVAGVGTTLLGMLQIPAELHHEAQTSVFALAAVICAGWPLKIFNDVLRGVQRFVFSAVAEITAYVTVATMLVALVLGGAPLWVLVAVGAMPQLLVGGASAAIVVSKRLPFHFRLQAVTGAKLREFLGFSSYLSLIGLSVLVIYALDRAILGAFRSAATVGLYEGPVRVHNLVQQVHAAFSAPVLPASSRFASANDSERMHDLLLRGTRYTLAGVVPLSITFMALARPILNVWLGQRFGVAATAMTLLVGYWLINANTGVAGGMLLAVGRVRQLTAYAGVVALVNLGLSLALTPSLGLNGVVLGTAISYVAVFPFLLALTLRVLPVTLREFVSTAWLPAYLTGAVVGAALVAVRLTLPLDRLSEVIATAFLALAAYWAIYYVVWLRPNERLLIRSVVFAFVRR